VDSFIAALVSSKRIVRVTGFAQKLKGKKKIRKAGKQEKSNPHFPAFLLSSLFLS
jgi:hypothetical protein